MVKSGASSDPWWYKADTNEMNNIAGNPEYTGKMSMFIEYEKKRILLIKYKADYY